MLLGIGFLITNLWLVRKKKRCHVHKKNSKKLLLVIFALVALLQLTAAVLPSLRSEIAYAIGDEYRFKNHGLRPAIPFAALPEVYHRYSTVDKASEQAISPILIRLNQPCY